MAKENITDSFGFKANISELKLGFEYSTLIQWDNMTETAYTNVSVNGWILAMAYALVFTGEYMPTPPYSYAY